MSVVFQLPTNLLRAGRVFTFEPPPGVSANLLRTFSTIPATRMCRVSGTRGIWYRFKHESHLKVWIPSGLSVSFMSGSYRAGLWKVVGFSSACACLKYCFKNAIISCFTLDTKQVETYLQYELLFDTGLLSKIYLMYYYRIAFKYPCLHLYLSQQNDICSDSILWWCSCQNVTNLL